MSPAKLKLLQISAGLNLAFAATTACALPYTIDGLFADWGVNSTTLQSSTARKQTIEDQHDSYLNPGYGGQKYDAEAMYLDWDANYLYVGVLTGLPSNNPHNPAGNSYGPGDIILDFGLDNNPEFAFKVITRNGLTKGKVYQPLSSPTTWHYGIWSAPNVLANGSNPIGNEVRPHAQQDSRAYREFHGSNRNLRKNPPDRASLSRAT